MIPSNYTPYSFKLYLGFSERYAVMKRCWRLPAEERPRFIELVAVLDKILQSAAGYIELSMTLNKSPVVTKEMEKEEEEEDWSKYEITRPEFITEHSKFSYANQIVL